MNGQPGAHVSEHAFGNALDIAAFTLANGRTVTVRDGWRGMPEEQGFLRDVEAAACEQFMTALAPGSNSFHYDHIHVDLMRRSSGTRICNPEAVSGEEVAARANPAWHSAACWRRHSECHPRRTAGVSRLAMSITRARSSRGRARATQSMIPKSGYRFSEKIMLQE